MTQIDEAAVDLNLYSILDNRRGVFLRCDKCARPITRGDRNLHDVMREVRYHELVVHLYDQLVVHGDGR